MIKLLISLFLLFCVSACNKNSQLASAQIDLMEERIQTVMQSDGDVLFMFFTDTHISHNEGHSLRIINSTLRTIKCPSVFWGGDAITAYSSDMNGEWEIQKSMLDSISLLSNVYAIRGNHDFTYKNKETETGKTLTQKEVSRRIINSCSQNIISDISNDSACYYYVDDFANKIRYIVFDTDDIGVYGNVPWGYRSSISHNQLDWIVKNAILTTPENYGIIFLSHIPITHNFNSAFSETEQTLVAAIKKTKINVGNEVYDFGQMNNGTHILGIVSGHNHHDMQVYSGGLLQIITASDAFYLNYQRSPLWEYYPKREKGTDREQVVELCRYNKEDKILFFFRFGYGGNRFYHLIPIEISIGDTLLLPTTIKSAKIYGAYDSDAKYSNNDKIWSLNDNTILINGNGLVTAKNIGETTVYAINKDGDTEFFDIIVK